MKKKKKKGKEKENEKEKEKEIETGLAVVTEEEREVIVLDETIKKILSKDVINQDEAQLLREVLETKSVQMQTVLLKHLKNRVCSLEKYGEAKHNVVSELIARLPTMRDSLLLRALESLVALSSDEVAGITQLLTNTKVVRLNINVDEKNTLNKISDDTKPLRLLDTVYELLRDEK